MKRSQMDPTQVQSFYQWASTEWARCSSNTVTIESHAITYLVGTNSGGVAAVATFAATASYSSWLITLAICAFLCGLFAAGLGIALGLRRLGWITRSLGDDQRLFNTNQLDVEAVHERHRIRFETASIGTILGWTSFIAFWVGAGVSLYTFNDYMDKKAVATVKVAVPAPQSTGS